MMLSSGLLSSATRETGTSSSASGKENNGLEMKSKIQETETYPERENTFENDENLRNLEIFENIERKSMKIRKRKSLSSNVKKIDTDFVETIERTENNELSSTMTSRTSSGTSCSTPPSSPPPIKEEMRKNKSVFVKKTPEEAQKTQKIEKIKKSGEDIKKQREEDEEEAPQVSGRSSPTSRMEGRQDHQDDRDPDPDHLHHLYEGGKAYLPGSWPEADLGVRPGGSWIASSLTPCRGTGSTPVCTAPSGEGGGGKGASLVCN